MKPEDVPEELLSLYGRNYMGSSSKVAARRALAAVLTAHERQVREQVAAEIEAELDADGDGSSWDGGMSNAARIARGESR